MLPNRWVILWNNQPVGLDNDSGGYPFKTDNPNQIKYWATRGEAERYSDMFINHRFQIIEIQFRIMDTPS